MGKDYYAKKNNYIINDKLEYIRDDESPLLYESEYSRFIRNLQLNRELVKRVIEQGRQLKIAEMARKSTGRTNQGQSNTLLDFSGNIYGFNRGAIGISQEGKTKTIIFDRNNRHHYDATIEIGHSFRCVFDDTLTEPFPLGVQVSEAGVAVLHLEGKSLLIYLPKTLTKRQFEKLIVEIVPRIYRKFEISFTHEGKVFDAVDYKFLCDYLENIIEVDIEKVLRSVL